MTINNFIIHGSHDVLYHTGIRTWACKSCGNVGKEKLDGLAKPCAGQANKAGRENLARISKGLMPGDTQEAHTHNEGRILKRKRR